MPDAVEELLLGSQYIGLSPHPSEQVAVKELAFVARHADELRSLPVLDSERWVVVQFIIAQVVLRRVRQEVRRYDERCVRPLRIRPREQPLQLLRRNTLFVVLALDEPRLNVLAAVDILALPLSHDVTTGVCGARIQARAFTPVNVKEA